LRAAGGGWAPPPPAAAGAWAPCLARSSGPGPSRSCPRPRRFAAAWISSCKGSCPLRGVARQNRLQLVARRFARRFDPELRDLGSVAPREPANLQLEHLGGATVELSGELNARLPLSPLTHRGYAPFDDFFVRAFNTTCALCFFNSASSSSLNASYWAWVLGPSILTITTCRLLAARAPDIAHPPFG